MYHVFNQKQAKMHSKATVTYLLFVHADSKNRSILPPPSQKHFGTCYFASNIFKQSQE